MLTKRTNILFDEGLWKRLTKIAEAKNTSAGQLIRDAIEEKINDEAYLAEKKQIDGNDSYLSILQKTKGAWTKIDEDQARSEKRAFELQASTKRKKAW